MVLTTDTKWELFLLCCHYFCAVVHVKRCLHSSLPGLNAYWLSLPCCLRRDCREAEWEKNSLFNRKQQGLWGNGTGASELSTRYNYSCQLYDWCLPLLLAMNKIGKQKAWNARVWCKERNCCVSKKKSFQTSFSLRKPALLIWFSIL